MALENTEENVLRTLNGVQYDLHHAGKNSELLDELGDFKAHLQQSLNVVELGNVIGEQDQFWIAYSAIEQKRIGVHRKHQHHTSG